MENKLFMMGLKAILLPLSILKVIGFRSVSDCSEATLPVNITNVYELL